MLKLALASSAIATLTACSTYSSAMSSLEGTFEAQHEALPDVIAHLLRHDAHREVADAARLLPLKEHKEKVSGG